MDDFNFLSGLATRRMPFTAMENARGGTGVNSAAAPCSKGWEVVKREAMGR